MASSQPTSSPARSASPDRFDLSPRSKLRKLLAPVDSDSDGDDTPRTTLIKSQFTRKSSSTGGRDSDAPTPSASGEDDDEDIVRPRGRLAGRMKAGSKDEGDDARSRVKRLLEKDATKGQSQKNTADTGMTDAGRDTDSDDGGVIRPRGRLASRMQAETRSPGEGAGQRASKSPSPAQVAEDIRDVEMADADDDEDTPVRSRKPNSRQSRSKTPDSTTQTPQKDTSPGLFVTPTKSPSSAQESIAASSGSDSDMPALKSDRFKALVEKKRKERLAREAEEARKKEARTAALEELGDDNNDDASDITDDDGGRKLTQIQKQSRPSRKASKKALEEMNRETQRMQRAMQLAHEAKTKKKITKATLFERFNYRPGGNTVANEKQQSSSRPQTPVSMKSTDAEMQDADTPPSSPPVRVQDVLGKDLKGMVSGTGEAAPTQLTPTNKDAGHVEEEEFPDLMDMQAFARKPLNKDKTTTPTKTTTKRQVRVKLPPIQANLVSLDSDEDDLIVINPKKSKLDEVFDRIPNSKTKQSSSLRLLRQLAHLDSPERKAYKKIDKLAMTPGELQVLLQQRAREQAKLERERRLEMLKAKGIHIQTEEQRERDREQIEDMVARAKREAEEIMQREREEAKKEKKAGGDDPLAWDDSGSDDDEYEEDNTEEENDDADVEFSGSEEDLGEGMAMFDDEDEDGNEAQSAEAKQTLKETSTAHGLVDEAANESSESDGSETEQSWVDPDEEEEKHRWGDEDEDMDTTPVFVQAMRPKQTLAQVSDDEDLEVETTPKPPRSQAINFTPKPTNVKALNFTPGPNNNTSPEVPTSVLRSAAKTFIPGMPVDTGGPAGLGLTQIFAGTMDDSQAGPLGGSPSQPMPTFENFPDSQVSQIGTNSADAMVFDSQTVPATQTETQGETQVRLDFTQSQLHGLGSLLRDDNASQESEIPYPTQDGGFQNWTPLKERFVEPPMSTVDTVVRDPSDVEDMSNVSPLLHKRSRLRKKTVIASDSEDEDNFIVGTKPSAFHVMKDAATLEKKQKTREEFDKKKSKAREMIEEQAEESEDEYAGLGGADGEDSDNDDAASVHEMIDDQTQGNKEDEVKIAALYAERQRVEDAKQTDKLFHDITRGMLRRKRGADYDLSDSDDGGEARRRMKRRQFAKMQKALFADERISKVAENPRNQAFMRTIEDIGSDEEMDFLFEPAPRANEDSQLSTLPSGGVTESQENDAHITVPDSQPAASAEPGKRAPAAERRTKNGRKPANIGEVRETLSNLLDEPSGNTVVSATDLGSDGDSDSSDDNDSESSNKENANPRRRRGPVVDRISLKRQNSSNVSTSSTGGRMAFAASSASATGGFKVPALLRKATTNSLMSSSSPNGSGGNTGSAGGFGDEAKIKKSAGKRSGISYLARETDRQAKLAEAKKRREAKKFKAVEGRGKAVGGLFGAGKFE